MGVNTDAMTAGLSQDLVKVDNTKRVKSAADIAMEVELSKHNPPVVVPPKVAPPAEPEHVPTRPPRIMSFDDFVSRWFTLSSAAQMTFMQHMGPDQICKHVVDVIYPAYLASLNKGWPIFGE